MYIRKAEIKNIRSIGHFEMAFSEGNEAGWHVLIGENGSGKSSIIRSIAAALIGPDQIAAVLPVWEEWLTKTEDNGSISLELMPKWGMDIMGRGQPPKGKTISNILYFTRNGHGVKMTSNGDDPKARLTPKNYNWGNNDGWFSVAYGPFRRFTGGSDRWSKVFYSAPKAGAHLSAFGEDIALTEALDWLKELDRRRLKERETEQSNILAEPTTAYYSETDYIFQHLKTFVNNSGLLHKTVFDGIDIDGDPVFLDGNNNSIKVTQMSDGFRSILSLTFELIRQLVKIYGAKSVFESDSSTTSITLPGVVLIDEIDAHLHPTWQTRIGQWFTKHFPNLQFIVTTHSPLICRGCVDKNGELNGSIWWLSALGSPEKSGRLSDTERDRLIFGNVLDAYGTGVFGRGLERNATSREMLEEYARLDKLFTFGQITLAQNKRRLELQKIFTTDVVTEF